MKQNLTLRFAASLPIELSRTGLKIGDNLTFEQWQRLGAELESVHASVQWWIGDWLNYGERRFGAMYTEALERTGYAYESLKQFKWVASRFELCDRSHNLTWTHYLAAAGIPDAHEWLERAEDAHWSKAQLQTEIRKQKYLTAQQRALSPTEQASATVYRAKAEWLLQQIPAESVDLLLTDPPYSTDVENIEAFAAAWLLPALAKVKSTGRAYICTGDYPIESLAYPRVLAQEPRLRWLKTLTWTYENTLGPAPVEDYKLNTQRIFYLVGPDAPPLNCPLMVEQFSAQDIPAPDGRQGNRLHAWQKPAELAERFIRHATKENDLVLDLFAGTGTFLHAAARLNRRGIGCEPDADMLALCAAQGLRVCDAS